MKLNKNVFEWENSLIDYLNPNNHIFPIVELPSILNPYKKDKIRIYAKLLQTTPLLNVKSIPAYNMLNQYCKKNNINDIDTLIESSSWNTVYSLGIVWRVFWVERTISMASSSVSLWKLKLLQFFWIEIILNDEPICPDPNDSKSWINKAKKMWTQYWKLNLWQYDNMDNWQWHFNITWPQIYSQIPDLDLFCAWLWTTWTFLWTSKYLKNKNKNIVSLWVVRKPNNPIPWPRTKNLLNQIDFDRESQLDYMEYVWTIDSYKQSLTICRYGILWWPSSGMNLKWLFQYIENNIKKIKNIVKTKWDFKCVFICCDTPLPYIDEYFKYLDQDFFSKIHNIELMNIKQKKKIYDISIDPKDFIKNIYWKSLKTLEKYLNTWKLINIKKNSLLIDLRNEKQFFDHWLAWFINIEFEKFNEFFESNQSMFNWKIIYLICEYWEKSYYVWEFLIEKWFNVYNIEWWMIERSNRNLPRYKQFIKSKS